ncbi:hypothetical protein [Bacillus sp. JCM 19034]|uniref:hypothetical protein n=1 Tax=Bacillus sp. JCM 19034 TaxID=1481928 RepID=UPI000785C38D|nr:hypothetical protein [Bacillus sp. JCM 19034]
MLQVTKLIIYLAVLFFIGYSYGSITKDTVFDNFFIMLLSLFILIFITEAIFAALKKRFQPEKSQNENKNDDPESWNAMMEEVKKDFEKTWSITYENHKLHIVNKYNKEQLFINEKLVDESNRIHWYS